MYEQSSLIIVVADVQGAVAALRRAEDEGRPLLLRGPERVAEIQGSAWFIAMIDAAKRQVPGVDAKILIDAGAAAGLAYDAIMRGADYVLFTGKASAARKLDEIAKRKGGQVIAKLGTGRKDRG